MKTKLYSSVLSLLCVLSSGNQTFASTELRASGWDLPELTYGEKQELVDSVKTVFNDFYVHRTQKKAEYNYDSQVEANKLSADMSSETLLRSVSAIFMNVKDLHTGFRYPLPSSCFIGGFPLKLNLAYGRDANSNLNEKLVIQTKLSDELKSRFASPEDKRNFQALEPGDEILSISNLGLENETQEELSAAQAIKKLESVARGANNDAAKTRAVQIFFSRNGASMKPPSGRFVLKVKHAIDNQIVSYEFPWIAYSSSDPACFSFDTKTRANSSNPKAFTHKSNIQLNNKDFLYEEMFQDVYSGTNASENVNTRIIELGGDKKFALIQMNRFVPAGIDLSAHYLDARAKIKEEVDGIREFILQNRDHIEGVIFDVRGNGGGYGSFPQIIANMFTTEFVSNMSVQPLVSKTNRDVFHNLEFSRYFTRLGTSDPLVDKNNVVLKGPVSETADEMDYFLSHMETNDPEIILSPVPRFDEDENDELAPEYTAEYKRLDTIQGKPGKFALKEIFTDKPIAVLTNSNCYSACDIFVSIMKDYNIAKIIGETGHTGGGGANVVEWNNFAQPSYVLDAQGTRGSVIPNAKELPKGSSMRFAWNRIVRERAQDQAVERYIEGPGVVIAQENIYRPTVKDVTSNSSDLLKRVMNDMVENRESYNTNR